VRVEKGNKRADGKIRREQMISEGKTISNQYEQKGKKKGQGRSKIGLFCTGRRKGVIPTQFIKLVKGVHMRGRGEGAVLTRKAKIRIVAQVIQKGKKGKARSIPTRKLVRPKPF